VEIRDVCVGACDGGDVFVTAYVSNAGLGAVDGLVAELWVGGELIQEVPVGEVPAETAVAVQLVSEARKFPAELEVRLGGQQEGACSAASAVWAEAICED
jgi:hypothetical protein